ncbi:MAG: hypothetical protein IT378_08080 [Sandaracinaceae bacterium]|nr:hypothetical protein [Sandaracinaceae bacterium]
MSADREEGAAGGHGEGDSRVLVRNADAIAMGGDPPPDVTLAPTGRPVALEARGDRLVGAASSALPRT